MGVEWYDMIARRNGGYKNNAVYTIEGISAEQIFEERLMNMITNFNSVLDAGCGHGDFTLKVSRHAKSIIGFDNSVEMIKIAESILEESKVKNVRFVCATTKTDLPFSDGQFDLIYDRRGPTSILNHSRILFSGGTVFGIHSGALETVKDRLNSNGFINIEIEEFNSAIIFFPSEIEFAKFISGIPGNPDYTTPELKKELELRIQENIINGKLGLKEYKYIWKAKKP
ncbi:SAM-dependent methyltransferase [Paenibacillus sp. V4I3]|uniref:class I SAM-dependent methyltransferase n=1 Tax=unclassified Paenibacillus TaxID=185978 RepID=UPI00278536ED|nr:MULTISPECIES: class I SAM-dependent methyltransferase [unclassified Paenibacillus]MDQ0875524.1 SAM-dependent methyltransferase [Paenibacillus sp. V4I3]MDQ0888395.1 SAM-dependent methyltransferase [Paenibacillus sp. V4I9]